MQRLGIGKAQNLHCEANLKGRCAGTLRRHTHNPPPCLKSTEGCLSKFWRRERALLGATPPAPAAWQLMPPYCARFFGTNTNTFWYTIWKKETQKREAFWCTIIATLSGRKMNDFGVQFSASAFGSNLGLFVKMYIHGFARARNEEELLFIFVFTCV